jgi:hypothetical protein
LRSFGLAEKRRDLPVRQAGPSMTCRAGDAGMAKIAGWNGLGTDDHGSFYAVKKANVTGRKDKNESLSRWVELNRS